MQKIVWSNKYRLIKISVSIILLTIMGIYSQKSAEKTSPTLKECFKYPEKYDLRVLKIPLDAKIYIEKNMNLTLYSRGQKAPLILKDNKKIEKKYSGQYISAEVVFHKEGYVVLNKYEIHDKRKLKMQVSLITALILMILFLMKYRFNLRNLNFEAK